MYSSIEKIFYISLYNKSENISIVFVNFLQKTAKTERKNKPNENCGHNMRI